MPLPATFSLTKQKFNFSYARGLAFARGATYTTYMTYMLVVAAGAKS